MVEVSGNLDARKFLKQFRVGPLHSALCEQRLSLGPASTESLEQKNGVGKLQSHLRCDVAPYRHRHLVTGVAAEAIDAPAAPRQEGFGQLLPKLNRLGINLDEVFPNRAPRARALELAIVEPAKPFRMIFLQCAPPAGVVDDEVKHDETAEPVRLIGQLDKLLQAGCLRVELHQCRVDRRKI